MAQPLTPQRLPADLPTVDQARARLRVAATAPSEIPVVPLLIGGLVVGVLVAKQFLRPAHVAGVAKTAWAFRPRR